MQVLKVQKESYCLLRMLWHPDIMGLIPYSSDIFFTQWHMHESQSKNHAVNKSTDFFKKRKSGDRYVAISFFPVCGGTHERTQ